MDTWQINGKGYMQRHSFEEFKPWLYNEPGSDRQGGRGEYTREMYFINNLPGTVYVRDRFDLRVSVEPANRRNMHKPDVFLIRNTFSCSVENKQNFVTEARLVSENDRNVIQKAFVSEWTGEERYNPRSDIRVENKLTRSMFEKASGVIYLEDFDLLLFYGENAEARSQRTFHPYSARGVAQRHLMRVTTDVKVGDFSFNIKIVDNFGEFGDRWLRIGDKVIRVRPVVDQGTQDGIYVMYRNHSFAGNDDMHLLVSHYKLAEEDAVPYFQLYKTQIDAQSAPEAQAIAEHEVRRKEAEARAIEAQSKLTRAIGESELIKVKQSHEITKLMQENENLKAEKETWIEKQKTEKLKTQAEQAKLANETAKQAGDAEANRRKNISELIKYVPLVLGLITTLAVKAPR